MAHDKLVLHPSSAEFVESIAKDVRRGFGFVPFVGSGLSAPSGILMGQQFDNFLAYTLYKVLCPSDEQTDTDKRWNPRADGWPRYPDSEDIENVRIWVKKLFPGIKTQSDQRPNNPFIFTTELIDSLNESLIPGIPISDVVRLKPGKTHDDTELAAIQAKKLYRLITSQDLSVNHTRPSGWPVASHTSDNFIIAQGILSLHDWRSTLDFLSRVTTYDNQLGIEESEPSVIDSFNIHITRDRQPNLGHKMLAHLSRPMRTRVILTTNFDTFIEDTFKHMHIPLTVLEVSVKGDLPSAHTVRGQDSLVKMHGGMIETRADFSLDEPPSLHDKNRFVSYLYGPPPNETNNHARPNRLFVVGYSGRDLRCVQMFKYLLDVKPDTVLYWVCFNDWDVDRLNKQFFEPEYRDKIHVFKTARPDLLLYELYQVLTLCLPAGGFSHEFTHKVPPQRSPKLPKPRKYPRRTLIGTFMGWFPGRKASFQRSLLGVYISPWLEGLHRNFGGNLIDSMSNTWVNSMDRKFEIVGMEAVPEAFGNWIKEAILSEESELTPRLQYDARAVRMKRDDENSESSDRTKVLLLNIKTGGARALEVAFSSLEKSGNECVWIELQDYQDVATLCADLLRELALRQGRFQLEHVDLLPSEDFIQSIEDETLTKHIKGFLKYISLSADRCILFFYGRNAPGGCAGWTNHLWNRDTLNLFRQLLWVLDICGFHVIYMPLTESRCERDKEKCENIEKRIEKIQNFATAGSVEEAVCVKKAHKKIRANIPITDAIFPLNKNPHAHNIDDDLDFENAHQSGNYNSIIDKVINQWLDPSYLKKDRYICRPSEYDENHIDKTYSARVRFLYATTLFRQSRHTSAFFAEAVYTCPERFNTCGIDNDWLRAHYVRNWVDELRDLGVFYYKPGGYCWKHRDIRLGLQYYLQNPGFDKTSSLGFNFLEEIRARIHFWIGDWYFKAFTATGHAMPAVESLYHRLQAIRYCPYAKPSKLQYSKDKGDIDEYRRVLFQSSVTEMIKTIQIAGPSLRFWLSGLGKHSFFSIEKNLDGLSNDLNEYSGENLADHVSEVFKSAWGTISSNIKNLSLDTSDGCQWPRHQLQAVLEIVSKYNYVGDLTKQLENQCKILARSLQSEAGSPIGKPPSPPEILRNYESDREEFIKGIGKDISLEVDGPYKEGIIDKSWKQAWADKLERNNSLKATDLIAPLTDYEIGMDRAILERDIRREKINWIHNNSHNQARLHRVVDFIGEFAYLHAKRAKLEYMALCCDHQVVGLSDKYDNSIIWKPDHVRFRAVHKDYPTLMVKMRWVQATTLCNLGLDICKHLHPTFWTYEIQQKIRLHGIYALALAHLDRFWEAHRHLNEAIALLSKSPGGLDPEQMAIIRLRRAEVYLVEALRLRDTLCDYCDFLNPPPNLDKINRRSEQPRSFINLMKKRHDKPHPLVVRAAEAERKDVSSDHLEFVNDISRLQCAALDDAWSALESAEKLLSGKSHSSLWWGRLRALQIRAFSSDLRGINWNDEIREATKQFYFLGYRRPIHHKSYLRDLLTKALLIDPSNDYRQLRLIEYYLAAQRDYDATSQTIIGDVEQRIESSRKEACRKSIPKDFLTVIYAKHVDEVLKPWKLQHQDLSGI